MDRYLVVEGPYEDGEFFLVDLQHAGGLQPKVVQAGLTGRFAQALADKLNADE